MGALKWTKWCQLFLQHILIKIISTRWQRSQMFSVLSESDIIGTWGLPSDVMELSTFGTVISFYSFFNQNFLLIKGGKLALVDSVPHFLDQFPGDIIPHCKNRQNSPQYNSEWEKNSTLILLPCFYYCSCFLLKNDCETFYHSQLYILSINYAVNSTNINPDKFFELYCQCSM